MIVNKNASLKKLNTFKVDASCDVLVESSSTNDLLEVLNNKELNNNLFILGGGSNILFTKHYQGTIINLKEESIKILDEGPDKVQVFGRKAESQPTKARYFVSFHDLARSL